MGWDNGIVNLINAYTQKQTQRGKYGSDERDDTREGGTDGRRKGGRHSKEKKGDRGEWGEEEKDGKGTGDEWMPANCEHILQ